jgi:YegS/Rv2252/BmrU family lipid kinase
MKALIVLNPAAGKNAREPMIEAIGRYFTNSKIEYEIYETVKGDKLGDIVRTRLAGGFDLVIAAGGDGTVSAVIDGLVGSSVPLGIIPAGTGNLIARELNIPLEIEDAVALIAGSHIFRKIDAMRIGKRAYILNVSVGISASVIGGTTHKNKSRFGRIAYLGTAILKIFTFRNRYLPVAIDGQTHTHRAVEVTISNCDILSKILYPKGPDVSIDDGHLDVWILSAKTFLDYPLYLFQMITRRPQKHLSHFISSEKSVSIKSRIPLPVQADGDIIGTTPVEVEVLKGALTVLVAEKPVPVPDQDLDRSRIMSQYLSGFAQTGRRK